MSASMPGRFTRLIGSVLFMLAIGATSAQAQVNVTASGGVANASYAELRLAFAAINSGTHTGTIAIDISGNTAETASAVLNASGGTSSYASISISPSGGATRTISGAIAGALIDLNGADNVTIDGLNSGGNALTIANTSTAATAMTLRFINDATSNMIRNVTLNGSSTGAALGTIYFGTTTGGTTGNDNNTVTGCNIGPSSASLPVNAIYALGTTTTAALNNSGVAITNNNIYDYFLATGGSSGMTVSSGNSDWTISGNSIYQTAARAYTAGTATSYGVFISTLAGAGNNFLVSGNFVGGRAANAGGAAWTVTGNFAESFVGIGTAVNSGSIQNNTIANFAWSGNGNWRGIQTTRGTVNIGTVTGNTIGAGTGTGSVTLTGALAAGTTAIGIDASSSTAGLLVAVSNNVIGAITTSGTGATIPVNITGILAGANVVSISNNTVGSTTTANSISANNGAGTASTGQFVTGISSSSAVALAITGNSVANLNDAYTGSVAGGQIRGILTTAGPNTISGNTVRNLSTASAATGVNASAAVIGIAQTSLTASNNVSQNVVHSLSSTAASAAANVIGIHYAGPTTGSNLVARNLIHSLSLATTSTAAGIIGINASGGIATYQNNMVRLGIDAAGNSLVRSYAITGIAKSTVSTPNAFYFNSVYVGGTGVAPTATNTYAFLRVATGVDDIRDNIFVNARQNAAGGGRHFAFALNAVTTVTSDYNVYSVAPGSADLASVDGGVTSLGTIQALRLTPSYGQDINSGAGDPRFVAPADPAASVSLKLQNPTPAEGTGISIGSVTDDQEGEARSTLSPADIGADAGLYSLDASTDIFTPRISYTPLVSTSLTGDRTVTATITDVGPAGGGLPSAGPNLPRIWYKKSTDGSWTLSNPGSLVSGDGRNGTWSFTIAAAGLSPTLGDVIQYYVVAQDQATAPNLWYNPVAATDPIHSDVTTQTTPPSAPNSYTIAEFAGTFYVPNDPGGQPTRTYPSLTKAGGFFAAVNSTPVSGNITVIVNGDVTNEDGTNKLNQWVEEGAGSYTLTIQPDAATLRTLSGAIIAANTPMLDMNGADRVTIDGSFSGGGQYLMLRNSGTASTVQPTIQFNNTATNDAVRNCIVENNTSNAARGDVVIGAVGANANIQITGNELRGSTGGTIGNPTNLIVGNNAGNSAITISNNNLHNFNFSAVNFGGWSNSSNLVGSNITISGNSAYGTASPSTNLGVCVFGIGGAGDGHLVSGNFIGGQAPQCGGAAWPWATGGGSNYSWGISIRASGTVTGSSVQGNTIQNMAFSGNIYGFYAINTENGKFAIGTVNGNTIGHPTTANSITFARGAVQAPIVIGINAGFGGVNSSLDVRNNVIANLVGVNSGSVDPYFRAISLSPGFPGTTGNCTVENNSITNLSFPGNGGSGNNSAGIIMATLGSPAPAVAYDIGGIAGNTLSGLTFGTGSAANYAIYIASGATTGQVVSNNNITGITGVMPFYGIGINTPYNAAVSSIQNNIVQGVTLSGASAEFRGISLTGTVVSPNGFGPASATGNLVGSDTAPNSISNSGGAATTGFWIEGYNSPSAGLIDLSNSIVANLTASGTGSAVAVRGIYSGPSGGNVGMSGVNIHDLSTAATNASDGASAPAVAGIWLMGAANPYVQNSTIHGLHATTTGSFAVAVDGIYANGGSGTVERNRVWDLTNSAGSATASVRGVYQYGGTWAMANNEISVTNGANTNPLQLFGIAQNLASGSGVGNVSYNSVYLGGSVSSGVANSYGFARQANFADVLADNLFFNDRTNSGGAGSHYAVSASATGSWSSDHNAFIATDAATLGQWSGADQAFAPWQAASGGDAASLGETAANVPAVQLLSDAANGILDIKPTSGYDVPPIVSNGGAPVIGITTDFGGLNIRDASHPDIGANEITVSRALSSPGTLAPASPNYAGNYDDLSIAGGGAPSMGGDANVFGVLSLGADNVTTNAYVLTIRPSGSVLRTSGHVAGNLRKYVPTGTGVDQTFEIGSGADYTPVDLGFADVSAGGYVQAATTAGDHPDLSTSAILPAKSANRYWTVHNQGATFTTANATLHFVPGDLDAGADPAAFVVQKFDSPSWSSPVTGVRTATSTEATGLTSFSDFAVGESHTVTLTYTAGSGGTISGTSPQTVIFGGDGTEVTAVPNSGYHFVDWSDAVATAARTDMHVTADVNVTANFAIDTYALTTTVVGSGSVDRSPNSPSYDQGTVVHLTATPAPGWTFVGWSGDASGSTNPLDVTMDAAKSITATFAINMYTLTTDVAPPGSGSVLRDPDQASFNHGSSVELTASPATGYHFVDWSGDLTGSTNPQVLTMNAAKSVTANFAINSYALTTTVVGNGSVSRSLDQPSYEHGTVVHLSATPDPGWMFVGWSGDASGSANPLDVTMDAAKSITATFALTTYTLTTDVAPTGGGTINRDQPGPNYTPGSVVQVTAVPATGYHFDSWSGALAGSANPQSVTLDGNKTVTANFVLGGNSITITTDGNGAGSVTRSPNYVLYAPGSMVTLTAVPEYGSTFTGWSGDLSGTTNPQTLTLDADKNVNATFVHNSYVLTLLADAASGGGVARNPDIPLYGPGEVVTLTAQPLEGWEFRSWCGDTSGTDSPLDLVMTGDETVVAILNEIGSPNVHVVFPNGSDNLEVGTVCSFEWTASGPGNVTSVDLLLSRSGPGGSFEVLDTNVPNTGSYLWTVAGTITNNAYLRVVAHGQSPNLDGWDMSDRRFEISSGLAAAGEPPVTQFALAPITPNPMRDRARVEFDLPRAAQVSLTIHDIMGRKLATLASGDFGAGRHSMTWDRSIDRGSAPAGVYFMRYTAGGRTVVRRFAIVR